MFCRATIMNVVEFRGNKGKMTKMEENKKFKYQSVNRPKMTRKKKRWCERVKDQNRTKSISVRWHLDSHSLLLIINELYTCCEFKSKYISVNNSQEKETNPKIFARVVTKIFAHVSPLNKKNVVTKCMNNSKNEWVIRYVDKNNAPPPLPFSLTSTGPMTRKIPSKSSPPPQTVRRAALSGLLQIW